MRTVTYCIVASTAPDGLFDALQRHWRGDPSIVVVRERRRGDRRQTARRTAPAAGPERDRRKVLSAEGRRVVDRRALGLSVEVPPLPRRLARRAAGVVECIQRVEPSSQRAADAEARRLVVRYQQGDQGALEELYVRYFGPVYSYALVALRVPADAEDATQHVFLRVVQALPRYVPRGDLPFRAWLFKIARHVVIDALRQRGRTMSLDPESLNRTLDAPDIAAMEANLRWLSDQEVAMIVQRLPDAQRQVIVLRFMLDLSTEEIAAVLDRSAGAIRQLQWRALTVLEARLAAVGRTPARRLRGGMARRMRGMPVVVQRRFVLADARPLARR